MIENHRIYTIKTLKIVKQGEQFNIIYDNEYRILLNLCDNENKRFVEVNKLLNK